MQDIQIGKWYRFTKLDKYGNKVHRIGIVKKKWSTYLKIGNMGGTYTCHYSQVLEAV
jgi:hypothetical protein